MNDKMKSRLHLYPAARALAALALGAACGSAGAALIDVSQSPLASASSNVVKPNIMFSLDTSGSMAWSHAPDDAESFEGNYGYASSQCNSIYYNPKIVYLPPKNYDGTDFATFAFNNAQYDGYDTSSPTKTDLSSKFVAWDNTTGNGNGSDTQQAAYYYTYSGTATVDFVNTSSTFYKECNSSIGSTPGKNVFTYVKVTSTSGPGNTDERQNFANWYSFYRTRILMMKSGAGQAFVNVINNYRVGFITIYGTPSTSTTDSEFLAIDDFTGTQKQTWYSRLYATSPTAGTPLRTALTTVGRMYGGKFGTPGSKPDPVQYSCQQNFLILTTDGYWNASSAKPVKLDGTSTVGDQDGSPAPRPILDGLAQSNTLSDAAAYYYNTDLRNGTVGSAACSTGPAGADVCQDNVPTQTPTGKKGEVIDDAPWQHMTTFTLGLGVNGQLAYATDYLVGGSADYNAIIAGTKDWPKPVGDTRTAVDDLWHAAVSGHGQYFSAKDPDLLVQGLRTALAGVSTREASGAAAATSNLEPIAGDNFAFIANYRTVKWDGDIEAHTIDLTTGLITPTSVWSGQSQLDAQVSPSSDTRIIFTFLAGAKTDFSTAGFNATQKANWFTPTNVPALTQSSSWSTTEKTAATADTVINYLRGQTGFEEQRTANTIQLYRMREHVLGDIIDGKPVYARVPPFNYVENNYQTFKSSLSARAGVVYIAANDGMLHAMDATTGNEKWAYVPSFVLPNLKALADDNYQSNHQFYVDGSPTVSDIWTGSVWKTILVGGLNAGGKGYYCLDVTDPNAPQVMWEFSDAKLGFSFGNPIIGKLTDGTWNVFFTSGYNNADGIGYLFVVNAVNGALRYAPISTGVGTATSPSGLGRISAWVDDSSNDNTVQRVYGGDMLGNLWRFDVNDAIGTSGREATVLAILKVGTYLQPITTKPELGLVKTKPVVFVGTGRYLGTTDLSDTNQQTLYAIRDDLTGTGWGDIRASGCLQAQTLTATSANLRTTSNTSVDFTVKCGWYLDFNPGNATPGERVNVDPKLQLGVLAVATNIPEKSVCTIGGSSFLYFLDFQKGTFVSTSTSAIAGQRISNAIAVGLNTYRLPDGKVVTTVTTSDNQHPVFGNPDLPPLGSGKRVLWRELLN